MSRIKPILILAAAFALLFWAVGCVPKVPIANPTGDSLTKAQTIAEGMKHELEQKPPHIESLMWQVDQIMSELRFAKKADGIKQRRLVDTTQKLQAMHDSLPMRIWRGIWWVIGISGTLWVLGGIAAIAANLGTGGWIGSVGRFAFSNFPAMQPFEVATNSIRRRRERARGFQVMQERLARTPGRSDGER